MSNPTKKKQERAGRRVLIELPSAQADATWKSVKLRAIEQDTTMSAWILEAITEKLTRDKGPKK